MEKAIIGGTGVYDAGDAKQEQVTTEYGKVLVDIVTINDEEIVFLARHGKEHSVPPHLINYRANMKALSRLGVKYIYSTAAVGSCNEKYAPGDVVVINDFMDFTSLRSKTFYEGGNDGVVHVPMHEPYCSNLKKLFCDTAEELGFNIKGEAVYVCTEGPRFETRAEILMYKRLGGDVVGMTNVPEVVLAKELGICYSTIGIITNWCTGMGNGFEIHDIQGNVSKVKDKITQVFLSCFTKGKLSQEDCSCKDSLMKL